jgi:hypothetical protein
VPDRLVHLLEQVAGDAAGLGERLAHADRLAPLAGKDECAHILSPYPKPFGPSLSFDSGFDKLSRYSG